jgi:hypothetical protein
MGDALSPDKWISLAKGCQDAGCDILELNFLALMDTQSVVDEQRLARMQIMRPKLPVGWWSVMSFRFHLSLN